MSHHRTRSTSNGAKGGLDIYLARVNVYVTSRLNGVKKSTTTCRRENHNRRMLNPKVLIVRGLDRIPTSPFEAVVNICRRPVIMSNRHERRKNVSQPGS